MLDPKRNFYVPSDTTLINACSNFGFELVDIRFPYIGSPYASPPRDHLKFILRLLGFNQTFPFWRNMMDVIFRKPN